MEEKEPKIQGYLDGIDRLYVYGWAWDPENPDQRLEVVVYVDGKPVAEGVADQYREDLKKAGIGDGKHGFRIKLSYAHFDGESHEVKVKVKKPEFSLGGKTFKFEKKSSIVITLDEVNKGIASGWAANMNNFSERLEIVLYIDGIPTEKAIANIFRKDLLEAGIGDGCYGFLISIPEEFFDGKEHQIKVKAEKYEIFSPQTKKFVATKPFTQNMSNSFDKEVSKITNTSIAPLIEEIDQKDPVGSIIDIIYRMQLKIERLSREIMILKSQPLFRELLLPLVKGSFWGLRSLRINSTMNLKPEQGFYPLERDSEGNPFRWTESTFYFDVHIDRSIPLKFKLLVIIKDFEQSKIKCFTDNIEIPLFTDFDSQGTVYNGILFPRDMLGPTRINFVVPKIQPPTDTDSRILGIIFKELTIEMATDEDIKIYLDKFKYE